MFTRVARLHQGFTGFLGVLFLCFLAIYLLFLNHLIDSLASTIDHIVPPSAMQNQTDYKAVAYFVNWCACTIFHAVSNVPGSDLSGLSMEEIINHRIYPRTTSHTYSMPLQMSGQKVEKCRLSLDEVPSEPITRY